MKVAVLTAGSRGDVEPYVALGSGLRDAGVEVRIATHGGFQPLVERHRLEFAEVAQPSETLRAESGWDTLQRAADTPARYVRSVARTSGLRALVEQTVDDHDRACDGADAVVSSLGAVRGPQHAAARGVPHCWALLQPMTPTRTYPQFMLPPRPRLPGWVNLRSHAVGAHVYRRLFGTGSEFGSSGGAIVYGISPAIVPRPRDWPPNVGQFGHWFLDPDADAPLPADVDAFLADGSPPVFVHAARIAVGDLVDAIAPALRRLGLRGIVSGADAEGLPGWMLAAPPLSFDRLFPRVAAVVHHGGSGTVASALRAGRPSVGVPGSFDQRFWSTRVAGLGAGPPPVAARRLTRNRLEQALDRLVHDPSFRARAADVGRRIESERGVEQTVAYLHDRLAVHA